MDLVPPPKKMYISSRSVTFYYYYNFFLLQNASNPFMSWSQTTGWFPLNTMQHLMLQMHPLCFSTEPQQTYRIYLFIRWNKWGFGCFNAFRPLVSGGGVFFVCFFVVFCFLISRSKTELMTDNKNMTKMKASLSSVQCSLCIIPLDSLHVGACLL